MEELVDSGKSVNLTKKAFMSFPTGKYLMSNLGSRAASKFLEKIVTPANREEQWARIKAIGVDQRLCRLFSSKARAEKWWKEGMP